jgi:hypothetical protein
VQGENHKNRESNHYAGQHRVLAIVGRGQRDWTPGWKPAGDAGRKVSRDLRFGRGFEGADDALVEMIDCGLRQVFGV